MSLTLMYITNNPVTARMAEDAGVDRIWVDMEYIGKELRQGGMNTVQNHHTVEDVRALRPVVTKAQLMVRVNPIHEKTSEHYGTEAEVDACIAAGADVLMLPMFRTAAEVERFVRAVNGRATVQLLVETAEAAESIDEILRVPGIDEIHIGLNDLHLAKGKKFMFELLCDGTVPALCGKIKAAGIKYGFGGIARVGYGMLPAEYVIAEHYALGSSAAILSRAFCDANSVPDPMSVQPLFADGIVNIRKKEEEVALYTPEQYTENHRVVEEKVNEIVKLKG
ncbi:MAG: aldolase [Clostridia bacterium]|nr:aldolase [Clostridia bacterium]